MLKDTAYEKECNMRCWSINAGQQKQMKFFKQIYGIQVPVLDDEKFSIRVLVSENLYHFRAEPGNWYAKQETCVEELKII